MHRGLARAIGAGAAIIGLGGCMTIAAAPGVTPLDRADVAFTHLQAVAARALPLLPVAKATRVRAILAVIGFGLDAARAASVPTARMAAIARVEAQLAALHTALHD